jgi:putative transposase
MPRPLRIEFENAWYHVMNRGASHQPIYQIKKHRYLFLEILAEANELFGIEIHGYCLMDNHYHLLIKTPRGNLSRAMQHINGIYTQRYNRLIKKDGPLFRGRYKAILIEKNDYLLQVSRYIHLNPVVANMVPSPDGYFWSSYQDYIGNRAKPNWLQINEILAMLQHEEHSDTYRRFVEEGVDDETKIFYEKSQAPVIFGTKTFKGKCLDQLEEEKIKASMTDYKRTREIPSAEQIDQVVAKHFNLDQIKLYKSHRGKKNKPREIAIYGCRMWRSENVSILAQRYGCHSHTNISNIVSKIKKCMGRNSELERIIHDIRKSVFTLTASSTNTTNS